MDSLMKDILEKYLKKYGLAERICSPADINGNWATNTSYEMVYLDKGNDLRVRDALVGQGRILEEDIDHHVYVDLIRVGKKNLSEALLVIEREDNAVHIAAYAKEGLIKQNLAKQAVEKATMLLAGNQRAE